ncbi:MAG: shikimate dehydrogenase, partial [Nanoarchaeota archaeon]
KRTPLYKKAADYEIDTNNKSVKQVGDEILELIKMKTEICIPITAETIKQAIADLKKAEKFVNLIELRIDFMKNIDKSKLEKLLKSKKKKIIVTCRPKSLCGNFTGNEKERINLLKKSIKSKADYIDIEMESNKKGIKDMVNNKNARKLEISGTNSVGNAKIIVSYHNFNETPNLGKLNRVYNEIKKLSPDLIKIVATANSINDNFVIFNLLKGKNDLIAFCMGLRGQISRILAPKYGSRMTFASLEEGRESASGQISIEEMKNVYNIDLVNNETKVVGVIGEFAENSMSKYMHNASFREKKLDFVYMPFKAKKEELKEFINNFRKFSFAGASVTIPHKAEVMKFLDKIDETAKQIGAVNTIVNKNGKLIGYNTDYYGAVEALKEKTKLKNKKALVVGAGGGARAVVYGLKKEGAIITITNRTADKAKILAKEFNVKFDGMENIKRLVKNNEIIINTTSVGMAPNTNESIINGNDLIKGKVIMDLVYKPSETKLIKLARKSKCRVITGDRMLIYQAIGPFKLWTGQEPNFKSMESALTKQIRH